MQEISASAEEMSAQVEELTAQAEELAATADQLDALATQFKIDGHDAGRRSVTPGAERNRPRLTTLSRAS
jgi:hypothetical protein